jgi:hypothetical protein
MNIHQTMVMNAGGIGSGRRALNNLGIHSLNDLKHHISTHVHRYTRGGKTMSHQEVLERILGNPAAAKNALDSLH